MTRPEEVRAAVAHAPRVAEAYQRAARALELLHEARASADELGSEAWQFAVELKCLRGHGLTNTDCRRLLLQGLIEHGHETFLPGSSKRTFQKGVGLALLETTCFVLSEAGARFLELPRELKNPDAAAESRPRWDQERHELWCAGTLVKQFKVPARNQEAILQAFEEEGWPHRIDDPLPPKRGQDPKRRVHDTINSLNRNQKTTLIRFLGDGTGQGILWEPVSPSDKKSS